MTDLVLPRDRTRAAAPFLIVAGLAILAGGLLAAVTGPLELEHGSWAAAYLVLVVGVVQAAFGTAQAALLADPPGPGARTSFELVAWNLGSLVVIAGTFVETPWLVGTGSALLLVALVVFMTAATRTGRYPRLTLLYRTLAGLMALSVAVGTLLSALRH